MKGSAKGFWKSVGASVVGLVLVFAVAGVAKVGVEKIREGVEDNKEIVDVVETPENGEEGAE